MSDAVRMGKHDEKFETLGKLALWGCKKWDISI